MARLKKCTEKDISILLETSSDSDTTCITNNSDTCYTPRKSIDNNTSDSSNSEIFDCNKSFLLRNNALRKEQASLRLKLRRSTEQSIYKIDTDSEHERPKRSTRSTKHKLKRSQDENQMPRKGARTIKLPKRYSDYDCASPQTSVLQRGQINYNEKKLFLTSLDTPNRKKRENTKPEIKDDDSDSDCVCVAFIPKPKSTRSNTLSKNNKRNRVSSLDDVDDTDTVSKVKTRSSKRIFINEDSKREDVDKVPFNEKSPINSNADTVYTSLDSTPKRRPRNGKINKNILAESKKCEFAIHENENKKKVDEVTVICKVTKDLSIRTKQNKISKEAIESPVIQNSLSTPKSRASLKPSALTPSVKMRTGALTKPVTPLQEVRSRLHVSAVPKSLPCREEEFNSIYTFIESKLMDNRGGCIYISGVPGTGKTATVNEVVNCLKRSVKKGKLDHFDFIEINGMKLSEPRQAYTQILKQLSGKILTWEQAYNALEKKFNNKAKRPMTLLLVDELDLLCTKRQDVVYNLLDWPAKVSAQLIVITIANTMDLPERVLMGRVTSRLGLTRITFQPYNHKQLQEIVLTRLKDSNIFKNEAIQLIARKVSAVSGDARRALDICRRAAEITETRDGATVSMEDVNEALSEMIANPKVQAIKHCSKMEQIFLEAVCTEVKRTGVEEVCFKNVYKQFESLCSFDGLQTPNISEILGICARLGSSRLLICEDSRNDIHQRILLNVSKDDIYYALREVDLN